MALWPPLKAGAWYSSCRAVELAAQAVQEREERANVFLSCLFESNPSNG